MAGKYWIKLYHEILDDPKMGRLEDRLYRRTIELFLLAGELDQDGYLPTVRDIAWRLRIDEEQLETEMIELQKVGILSVQGGRWLVTKFAERQAPMEKAEYMRRLREERQREQYYQPRYQPVTGSHAESDTDTDKDKESEEEGATAAIFKEFESGIGILNGHHFDILNDLIEDHGAEKTLEAVRVAIRNQARHINYVVAILENQRKEGQSETAWIDELFEEIE